MFKKLFAVATAAIVLAGCAKDVASVGSASSELKPISFSAYTQGQTRADVDDSSLESINVLANHTPSGGTASKYFYESIDLTSSAGESTKYWPASGSMDFYASNFAVSDDGVVTVTSIDNDVVVASSTNVSCPQSDAVSLTFSHIFAKLTVQAKVADEALSATISKIEVVAKAPARYDIKSNTLTNSSADAAAETYFNGSESIDETTLGELTLSKFYIAPQDGVKIKVYCTVSDASGSPVLVDKSSTPQVIDLNASAGTNHVINLTFDATKIAFSITSVSDFTDAEAVEEVK